ncbi:M48 family metalloprotease [Micromonospora rubida]|uniref:M48 family metalloprotease n=1 Tax=Micromonospora rubida TaxID=2697657 RepID=UPI001377DAB9|nr:M48 family metalloprotease [Micromonospora rubida]NBE84925.1 M48 family metalloprotease [Micromonospora rubida]
MGQPSSAAGAERGLRWLHLLVLLALVAVGVGAGDVVFVVHNLGHWGEVQACAALHDLPTDGGQVARLVGRGAEYDRCATGFEATRQAAQLAGGTAMLVLAGLVVFLDGLSVRLGLSRRGRRRPPDGDAVARIGQRFEFWCDELGLRGRGRPRVVVAPVGAADAQAYTTAVPYGRAVVVVPVAHAYGRRDVLDLVVLHELAHVRAREVSWASATWWAGWLVVPALLSAMAPVLVAPAAVTGPYAVSLSIAAGAATAMLILRAAVLRRREHAADRFAVDRGDLRDALVAAADDDGEIAGRPARWRPGRLFATHPDPSGRVAALERDDRWEGGFAVAAVVGLAVMSALQSARRVLLHTPDATLPLGVDKEDLAVAVAALVWAAATVSIWIRHPASTRRRWWARVLGAAVGLAAGCALPSVGTTASIYATFTAGFGPAALAWLVPALVGVAALAAGLADAVAALPSGARRVVAALLSVLGAAVLLTSVALTATLLLYGHWAWRSVAIDRVLWSTPGRFQSWAAVALVAACVLPVVARSTAPTRPPTAPPAGEIPGGQVPGGVVPGGGSGREGRWSVWRLALLAAVAGIVAGLVGTAAAAPLADRVVGDDAAFFLLSTGWWACAAAGWAVALAILLSLGARGPDGGVAVAWLAGAGVTAVSGVVRYAGEVLAGRAPAHPLAFVQRPWWLLTALVLFSAPAAVLVRDVVAARRERVGRPPVPRRAWPVPVATLAGAVAVTCVVALGWSMPVTGRQGDLARLLAARVKPAAADGARGRPAGTAPGRPLTRQGADAVLAEARRGLPSAWPPTRTVAWTGADDPATVRPSSCADRFAAVRQAEERREAATVREVRLEVPAGVLPPLGATLNLRLTSYPSADAGEQVVAEARDTVAACPRWSVPAPLADDGVSRRWAVAMPAPDLPYDACRTRITESSSVGGLPAVTGGAMVVVGIGHNVAVAEIAYGRPFRDQLEQKEQGLLDDLAVVAARLIVNALDS